MKAVRKNRKSEILALRFAGNSIAATARELGMSVVYIQRASNHLTGRTATDGKSLWKPEEAAFNRLLRSYKANAKRRKYEFTLTAAQFRAITKQSCAYCGAAPSAEKSTPSGSYVYNGVDRQDTRGGYTISNSVAACRDCNQAKSNWPTERWFNFIKRVAVFNAR